MASSSQTQSLVLSTKRGGRRIYHNDYLYNMLRINENSIRWKCSTKSCPGKISSNVDEPYTEFFDMVAHSHGPLRKNLKSLMLREEIMRKAMESNSTPQKIISEVLENVDVDVAYELGNNDTLRRTINRKRAQCRELKSNRNICGVKRCVQMETNANNENLFGNEEFGKQPSTSLEASSFHSAAEDEFYEPEIDMTESGQVTDDDIEDANELTDDEDDDSEVDEQVVKSIVKIYKSKCKPIRTSAKLMHLGDNNFSVVTSCLQKNWVTSKNIKLEQTFLTDKTLSLPAICTSTHDISDEKLVAYSLSRKKAVVREVNCEGTKMYNLEIWSDSHIEAIVDLGKQENLFGNIYTNDVGILRWSPQENHVMFLAEKPRPKSKSFLNILEPSTSSNHCVGREYNFIDNFGEQLSDVHKPVVVIYNTIRGNFSVLNGIPKNIAPFDAIWTPRGEGVVGVGVKLGSNRVGLVYCTNRPSVIFHLTLEGEYVELNSNGELACNSPRISPDGKYLVWLQRPAHGPHRSCLQLMKFNWCEYYLKYLETQCFITRQDRGRFPPCWYTATTAIDCVRHSSHTSNGSDFYGLYCSELPERCFSSDTEIFLSTPQRFKNVSYRVDLETNDIEEIVMDGSCTVLDVFEGNVVISSSKLNKSSELFVAKVETTESRGPDESCVGPWLQITKTVDEAVEDDIGADVRYYKIVTEKSVTLDGVTQEINSECSVIYHGLIDSASPKSRGLLIVVHGGPHSASVDTYSANSALYVEIGFNLIFVNFHGSIGFGQNNVESLLGRIGEIDLEDVELAVSTILSERTEIDPEKIAVIGGSYGGYLAIALSQRSNVNLKAVVVRNPAVDLTSLSISSDIPDWAMVESGFQWREKLSDCLNNEKARNRFKLLSLLADHHKVRAPTLLLIGAKDKRVPPTGALAYYRLLREANVTTKLLSYDDGHALSSFNADLNSTLNSALWLSKHVLRCDS